MNAPANGSIAPTSFCLLVIKNSAGVPSVARHVRLDSGLNIQPGHDQFPSPIGNPHGPWPGPPPIAERGIGT